MKEAKASTAAMTDSSPAHSQGCRSWRGESFMDRANSHAPSSSTRVNSGSLATKLLYRILEGRKETAARATRPHSLPPSSRAMRQTTRHTPTSSTRLNISAVYTLSPKMPSTRERTWG